MKTNTGKIALAYSALFAYGIIDNMRSPAYPAMVEHFRVTQSAGSLIFALASLASLPTILLGRFWLGRLGAVKAQTIFILFLAAGSLGTGLSFYFHGGFAVLLAASLLLGIGCGASSITANVLISEACPPSFRRRFYSGLHSMYGVASVAGPVIYGMAVMAGKSWHTLFLYLALAPLAVFAIGAFSGRRTQSAPYVIRKPPELGLAERLKPNLTLALYVAAEIAVSSRLVLFSMDALNIDGADASGYLSFFFLMLLTGRLLFSAYHFPWRNRNLMLLSASSSAVLCLAGIFIHPAFFPVSGFSMSFFFPCGMDWLIESFGKNAEYLMMSSMTAIIIALILMHWGVGVLTDLVGIKYALLVCPALLAGSIALLIFGRVAEHH